MDEYGLPQNPNDQAYVWYLDDDETWSKRYRISLEYDFVQFAMPLDEMLSEIKSRHHVIPKKDRRLRSIVRRIKILQRKLIYYYSIDYKKNIRILNKGQKNKVEPLK